MFEKEDIVKSGFDKEAGYSFLKEALTRNNVKQKFDFPSLMKKLNEPLNVLDLEPLTYIEITGIINKLKSSESSCRHDQMSIIIQKICLILRTFIYKLISHC